MLRRSVSRAPSAERSSPAASRWSADRGSASPTSISASRDSPRHRASRAPSSSSSTGPAKLTPEDSRSLTETAYNAFKQGTSLADFVSDLVQNYYDMISADHPHHSIVEQFQQKLAEVEPDLTIQFLREITPTLPRRFAKSFSPAITAWVRFKTQHWTEEQDKGGTSAAVPASSKTPVATAPPPAASPSNALEQGIPAIAAAPSLSQPDVDHGSGVDSASSPQAFGTPPEQPDEEAEEHGMNPPDPGADAKETRMLEDSGEAGAPKLGKSVQRDGPAQEEQQERENPAHPDEERYQGGDEDASDFQDLQEQASTHKAGANEEPREEDELVDELEEEDRSEAIAGGEASTTEGMLHADHVSDPAIEQAADAVSANAPEQATAGHQGAEEEQVDKANGRAQEVQSSDGAEKSKDAGVETLKTQYAQADESSSATCNTADVSEVEGAGLSPTLERDEQQASHQDANRSQEQDAIITDKSAVGDEPADLALTASAVGGQPIPAEDSNGTAARDLEPAADAASDRVASAVDAVEQANPADSEVQRVESLDASVIAAGAGTAAEASMQEAAALDASSEIPPDAAASEGPVVTTPPIPSRAKTEEAESRPQAGTTGSENAMVDPRTSQQEAVLATEAAQVEHNEAPAASASGVESCASPVSAAVTAVAVLNDASVAAEEGSGRADQPSEPSTEARTPELTNATDVVAEHDDQVRATVVSPAAQSQLDMDSAQSCRSHERESSQAASESTPNIRPRRTIDDRMKSMLKDLASVTGRRSSYKTIQKLKPLLVGGSKPDTISDLVEHWQDPSRMIPWQCLQELGPGIFHKKAHEHLHLSMHELMDKVSNTKSVQHLTEKLPERVMTRALMEFPRIPHMLHCWSKEKFEYFNARGLPQPTDVKPEFRYADQERVEDGGADALRSSAHPSRGSNSPVSAPSSTQMQPQPQLQPQPLRSLPSTMPQAPIMNAAVPSQVAHLQQAAMNAVTAVSPQALTQVGSQVLAAHIAQHQQQHYSNAAVTPDQRAQLVAALHTGPIQAPPLIQQPAARAQMIAALHSSSLQQAAAQQQDLQQQQGPHVITSTIPASTVMSHQQQQQQQQQQQVSDNARRAAMVKEATDRVFSGLAADCLSFAEQVVGSSASNEVNSRAHYSEADVLHVLNFVVNTYKGEVESDGGSVLKTLKAEERMRKIESVRAAALKVLTLTQTLCRIKVCLNEAASAALRATGEARTENWLDLLNTSTKWSGVKQFLLSQEQRTGAMSRAEAHMLLQKQVDRVNKRLEEVLEQLMSVDDIIGGRVEGGSEEDQAAEEAIRKECEQIGRICCKHVVGILVG